MGLKEPNTLKVGAHSLPNYKVSWIHSLVRTLLWRLRHCSRKSRTKEVKWACGRIQITQMPLTHYFQLSLIQQTKAAPSHWTEKTVSALCGNLYRSHLICRSFTLHKGANFSYSQFPTLTIFSKHITESDFGIFWRPIITSNLYSKMYIARQLKLYKFMLTIIWRIQDKIPWVLDWKGNDFKVYICNIYICNITY